MNLFSTIFRIMETTVAAHCMKVGDRLGAAAAGRFAIMCIRLIRLGLAAAADIVCCLLDYLDKTFVYDNYLNNTNLLFPISCMAFSAYVATIYGQIHTSLG